MAREKKRVSMHNSFDALHIDTSHSPGALLLEAYKQTAEALMEQLESRGYIALDDLRVTIDVSVVVETKESV